MIINKKMRKCLACGREGEGLIICPDCQMLMEEKSVKCQRTMSECICERNKYEGK